MIERWTCANCGRSHDSEAIRLPVGCACGIVDEDGRAIVKIDGDVIAPIPLVVKAKRYSKSTLKWMAAGSPVRTDAEVDAIFRDHCSVCPGNWFKNGTCTHRDCGCQIRTSVGEKMTLFGITVSAGFANNKLRRETEHCPIRLW